MVQKHNVRQAVLAERIFDGFGWHDSAAVLIQHGRVQEICTANTVLSGCQVQQLPAGSILAHGFIDLQVNGGGGVLLNDTPTPEAMRAIARAHRPFGTTALLPTLITDTREKAIAAIAAAKEAAGSDGVLGLQMEGPFLNPARAGVHRKPFIANAEMRDLDWLLALADAGHSMITLAPECVPQGFIHALVSRGIRVCAGHSEAGTEVMQGAIAEGLTGVTHLFNAMPPFAGRAPGIIGTALSDPRVIAGIIVDGLHVDPVSVRAAFAAKGEHGIALVTDAMPTVGASATSFDLLGTNVSVRDGRLVTDEGTLAGAHLDMASAVRNAVHLAHIPLEHALISASRTPARFLGIDHECGMLIPGVRADLVALSCELTVLATWVAGECEDVPRQ
ncbi:MAG TPA: N-acetylglucosamine-6-phosphate deacetylase [Rhizomicrobium sp.]|jgi:N-acetylglucosamine-6-phosphate deacetylase|nr:N-acetylglucosamine-6-phosphate deacetylase [Rhizomicrobium sp.]